VTVTHSLTEIVRNLRKCVGHNSKICLALTTSNEDSNYESYLGGCRIYQDFAILSIINLGQIELSALIPNLRQLNLYYLLVDTDKKHPFELSDSSLYLSNLVSELMSADFTNIVPFSSTKLTADSVVNKLLKMYGYNLSGISMCLVGLGSIGFQVALDLVRQGVNINVHSRDHIKALQLAGTINILKSQYTIASASYFSNLNTALALSTVLIDCSSAEDLYQSSHKPFMERLSGILTVSKRSFSSDLIKSLTGHVEIIRTDISHEIINLVLSSYNEIVYNAFPGFKHIGDIRLVSGGFKGIPGDIVVDSVDNPLIVIGMINSQFRIEPIYKCYNEWLNSD